MTEKERLLFIKNRVQSANETIGEISSHIENKYWNTEGNRMYYACFHAVTALLAKYKIFASTHSGTIRMFGQHIVLSGKIKKELGKHYSELFEKKQGGDYSTMFKFDEETISRLHKPSVELIHTIEAILDEESDEEPPQLTK